MFGNNRCFVGWWSQINPIRPHSFIQVAEVRYYVQLVYATEAEQSHRQAITALLAVTINEGGRNQQGRICTTIKNHTHT